MKTLKLFWLTLLICVPLLQLKANVLSNNDEIILTVCSDGVSKEEATKLALRNAIEQAYGAFISSNTTILNDEIVKDEIVTIASGNIKSYEEVSCEKMPNGKIFVVVKATVSLSRLADYAVSKGESVKFNGSSFAINMKLIEMNRINEQKILENLLPQLKNILMNAFDYQIKTDTPFGDRDSYRIPITVIVKYNENLTKAIDLIKSTLSSLYLSKEELDSYKSLQLPCYEFALGLNKEGIYSGLNPNCLRNDVSLWCKQVISLFWGGVQNFKCNSNIGVLPLKSKKNSFEKDFINYAPEYFQYLQKDIHTRLLYRPVRPVRSKLLSYRGELALGFEFWIKKKSILEYDVVVSPSQMEKLQELEIVKIQ